MAEEYEQQFIHGIALLSERVALIKDIGEAERLLVLHSKMRPAMPKWANPIMDCLHEVIISRMWLIYQGEPKENSPGVYVILFADGHIKIGKTKYFSKRLKNLSDQATSTVESHEFFPCEKASKIEAAAHRFLSSYRVKNEFFKIDFDHACEVVKSLVSPSNAIKH